MVAFLFPLVGAAGYQFSFFPPLAALKIGLSRPFVTAVFRGGRGGEACCRRRKTIAEHVQQIGRILVLAIKNPEKPK